jgi:GTP cyclohydrolase III
MRKGITCMEPASENLRLMANLTIQIGTDKTWDQYFGGMQYTLVKREKLNVLTFYLGGKNVMLISAEPDFDLDNMNLLRDTLMTIYITGIVPEKVKK